ncbi:hypothetical protein HW115_02695 [Verrucomicrobiaceae bacterium N1E253]|uniref:Uncharacterized protein n=1 Tax=Oceaniferula marina TaxID=2748318 RepID=A0A851GA62_9BACT|nr:hypothetical protein [Oceaniferula marina]NWK54503.1 hypothetical protein [Oceaniferula marina]
MSADHQMPRTGFRKKMACWVPVLTVFLMVNVVVGFVVIPIVYGFFGGNLRWKVDLATATHNAKQLHLALFEFDQDYGFFPGDQTAEMDEKFSECVGDYSNDYLKQLFVNGNVTLEENFYARGGSKGQYQPDGDVSTLDRTLQAGECGFAYVKNMNTSHDRSTPLLLAAMYGDGYKFNTDVYSRKAMTIRIDGSVKHYALDDNYEVVASEKNNLFGPNTDFNPDHLCYAKYPYAYKPSISKWIKRFLFTDAGLIILMLFISIPPAILAYRSSCQ